MACPYFIPERRMEYEGWIRPPRLPLGGAYAGRCSVTAEEPTLERQRGLCNQGYARGVCSCFPAEARADAVRFSFIGETQRLVYILERDHAPVEHGEIAENTEETGAAQGRVPLDAQARAFLESFARRARIAGLE